MTSVANQKLLQLNTDTIESVRRMYGLDDPKIIEEAIDILNNWILKQHHFVEKTFPRKFLEMSIIHSKGSIERAKLKLENLCTLRTMYPKYYNFNDLRNKFTDIFSYLTAAPLPKLSRDHYRIVASHIVASELFFKTPFTDYYVLLLFICEYIKMYDYCSGIVMVLDYRDIAITDIISKLNPIEFKQIINIILDVYGMRIKDIHLITASKTIEMLLKIVNPLMPTKIANRFHVHTSLTSLYEYESQDILPAEFGGSLCSLKDLNKDWIELLNSPDSLEYLNWSKNVRVDESYRFPEKYNKYKEMSGTFRSLSID